MSRIRDSYRWLLLSPGRAIYWPLALMGVLELAYAPFAGTWTSRKMYLIGTGCGTALQSFRGMDAAYNWWMFPIALPLSLFLLRFTVRLVLGASADGKDFTPPAIALIPPPACNRRRDDLVRACTHPAVMLCLFLVVLGLHAYDMYDVVSTYAHAGKGGLLHCPQELDWSVYFAGQGSGVTRTVNVIHVILAYSCQFLATLFALNIFTVLVIHNIFYLRLIYQRHSGTPEDSIVLDFDDKEDCFGQGMLHPIFNLQIVVLIVGGICVLASRYYNVTSGTTANATKRLEDLLSKADLSSIVPSLLNYVRSFKLDDLFHDSGQIILSVAFATVFVVIAIPSLIKFLPFRQLSLFNNGVARYLAEFLPAKEGSDPLEMNHEQLMETAAKFARNSFWPAGDPKAERLFVFVYLVLIFIFVPLPFHPLGAFVIALVILLGASMLLTGFTFTAYRYILGYVGKPLVQKPKD